MLGGGEVQTPRGVCGSMGKLMSSSGEGQQVDKGHMLIEVPPPPSPRKQLYQPVPSVDVACRFILASAVHRDGLES